MSNLVLIKACLNGNRPADAHPALPVTPEQLAAAAVAVVEAGAGAVHIHPRGVDGAESSDPDDIAAAVAAVRDAVPGLPVGVTSGLWNYGGDETARLASIRAWTVQPDFVSVNWAEPGAVELAEYLISRGVGVEAGLTSVHDTWIFNGSPISFDCLRALVEVRDSDRFDAATIAAQMDEAMDAAGIDVSKLHHGFGEVTWKVLDAAFKLGHDVRIGLEDTLVLPDGTQARDNAELVSKAVEMARARGLEPRGFERGER